jgi:hypothetical protein
MITLAEDAFVLMPAPGYLLRNPQGNSPSTLLPPYNASNFTTQGIQETHQ